MDYNVSGNFVDIVLSDSAMLGLIDNVTLTKTDCNINTIPTAADYLIAVGLGGQLLLALAIAASVFILSLYGATLHHVARYAPSHTKTHTICVVSVYPIVALVTLCATAVPRAQLLAEALTQAAFTVAWYQFLCLALSYCGGESALLAAKPDLLTPRVPPLCCFWPCMPKQLEINKRNLRMIRGVVLQLPVVQCLLYIALLVAWAEQQSLAAAQHVVFVTPVMFISIFTGLWGMSMLIRMLGPRVLAGFHLKEKMLVLQFVLILSKLQGFAVRGAVWGGALPCHPPLAPTVFANLIFNILMMTEMVVLQLLAWYLYRRPLPKSLTTDSGLTEVTSAKSLPSISSIVSDRSSTSRGRQ